MSPVDRAVRSRDGEAPGARWPIESRAFAVVAVVVLAAVPLGLGGLAASTQLRVIAVPALLLGLPHGALDPVLARRLGVWENLGGGFGFHAAYLALAGITVAAFLVLPIASLALFLAATAWHFSGDQREVAGPAVRLATGAALVSLPAIARPGQVGELYELVTVRGASTIADAQASLAPLVLLALGAALLVLLRRDRRAAVEVALTAALGLLAPPLVFFAVYFVALHSPRHLRETVAAAGGGAREMLSYALLAAVGLVIAGALMVPRSGVDAAIAASVFVGLAALTTPHMLLVERAQQRVLLTTPS